MQDTSSSVPTPLFFANVHSFDNVESESLISDDKKAEWKKIHEVFEKELLEQDLEKLSLSTDEFSIGLFDYLSPTHDADTIKIHKSDIINFFRGKFFNSLDHDAKFELVNNASGEITPVVAALGKFEIDEILWYLFQNNLVGFEDGNAINALAERKLNYTKINDQEDSLALKEDIQQELEQHINLAVAFNLSNAVLNKDELAIILTKINDQKSLFGLTLANLLIKPEDAEITWSSFSGDIADAILELPLRDQRTLFLAHQIDSSIRLNVVNRMGRDEIKTIIDNLEQYQVSSEAINCFFPDEEINDALIDKIIKLPLEKLDLLLLAYQYDRYPDQIVDQIVSCKNSRSRLTKEEFINYDPETILGRLELKRKKDLSLQSPQIMGLMALIKSNIANTELDNNVTQSINADLATIHQDITKGGKKSIDNLFLSEFKGMLLPDDKQDVSVLLYLLTLGADVNFTKDNKTSMLLDAYGNDMLDLAYLLVAYGADINALNGAVLQSALEEDDLEFIKYLASKGGNLNIQSLKNKHTPLIQALDDTSLTRVSKDKKVKIAQYLLKCDSVDVNVKTTNEYNALAFAVDQNNLEAVRALIDRTNDINCNSTSPRPLERNIIQIAIVRNNKEIIKLLLSKNVDLNYCNKSDETALSLACKHGDAEIIKLLLDKNTIDLTKGYDHESSLNWLLSRKGEHNIDLFKLLIEKGADVNGSIPSYPDGIRQTLLYWSLINNHSKITEILISTDGIDLNKLDSSKETPLFAAIKAGNAEMVSLLLKKGANPFIGSCDGNGFYNASCFRLAGRFGKQDVIDCFLDVPGIIYEAIYYNDIEFFKKLMAKNIDLNQPIAPGDGVLNVIGDDHIGSTILEYAIKSSNGDKTLALINDPKVNYNQLNITTNMVPIQLAISESGRRKSNHTIFFELLKKIADVNEYLPDGSTILLSIAQLRTFKKVELLEKFFRESTKVDIDKSHKISGRSPLYYLVEKSDEDACNLLITEGARLNEIDFMAPDIFSRIERFNNVPRATIYSHFNVADYDQDELGDILKQAAKDKAYSFIKNIPATNIQNISSQHSLLYYSIKKSDDRLCNLLTEKEVKLNKHDFMASDIFSRIERFNNAPGVTIYSHFNTNDYTQQELNTILKQAVEDKAYQFIQTIISNPNVSTATHDILAQDLLMARKNDNIYYGYTTRNNLINQLGGKNLDCVSNIPGRNKNILQIALTDSNFWIRNIFSTTADTKSYRNQFDRCFINWTPLTDKKDLPGLFTANNLGATNCNLLMKFLAPLAYYSTKGIYKGIGANNYINEKIWDHPGTIILSWILVGNVAWYGSLFDLSRMALRNTIWKEHKDSMRKSIFIYPCLSFVKNHPIPIMLGMTGAIVVCNSKTIEKALNKIMDNYLKVHDHTPHAHDR